MITRAQLIEWIRKVAATEPDFVYDTNQGRQSCTYLSNCYNAGGCIVGEALANLGLPHQLLQALDALGRQGINVAWGAQDTVELLTGHVEPLALTSEWVMHVQVMQDGEYAWADAVREADEEGRRQDWVLA